MMGMFSELNIVDITEVFSPPRVVKLGSDWDSRQGPVWTYSLGVTSR